MQQQRWTKAAARRCRNPCGNVHKRDLPRMDGPRRLTSTQLAHHEAGMGHMEVRRGHRTGASCDHRQAGASDTSLRTYHTHAAADWAAGSGTQQSAARLRAVQQGRPHSTPLRRKPPREHSVTRYCTASHGAALRCAHGHQRAACVYNVTATATAIATDIRWLACGPISSDVTCPSSEQPDSRRDYSAWC